MKGRRFFALASLGALTRATACSDALVGPSASSDHGALFDDLWHQVDLHYSFFTVKGINWDSVGAANRPLALAARSDAEFAGIAARMLSALEDVHVAITPTGRNSLRYVAGFETTPTYFDKQRVFRRYVTESPAPGSNLRFGLIASDVGYIYIPGFMGTGWAGEMDAALSSLGRVASIIVDVRDNLGGKNALAIDLAGRFTDRSRTYGYVRRRNGPEHSDFTEMSPQTVVPAGPTQFNGRVFVLSNRRSASSAEDFVRAMGANPNVTVVGDTTAGAAGGPIVRELANGWTYQLSEWIEYTLDRAIFEDIGLVPDVAVKPTATDASRDVDPILERAIALAKGG